MTRLAEIENSVASLPRRDQVALLRRLAARLHSPERRSVSSGKRKSWPVAPPKVSKKISREVMKRIEAQFEKIEPQGWK